MIIDFLYIGTCCLVVIVAFSLLLIACIGYRQCADFSTLLACNSIFGGLLLGCNAIGLSVYMYLYDVQLSSDYFILCSLRGYIHHSAIAFLHHSLVLQAVQKYCSITRNGLLDTTVKKICFVAFQWIFDFSFCLPLLLTGNIPKLPVENVCLITFSKPYFLFSAGGIVFFVSDIIMIYVYWSLIKFVRNASTKVHGGQQQKMNRDMEMVRRIVMLHFILLFLVLPAFMAMIIAAIRIEILPDRIFRVFCFMMVASALLMLVMLCWITPKLRKLVTDKVQQANRSIYTKTSRVTPLSVVGRSQLN